jgi:hypothetical protein
MKMQLELGVYDTSLAVALACVVAYAMKEFKLSDNAAYAGAFATGCCTLAVWDAVESYNTKAVDAGAQSGTAKSGTDDQ